MPMRMEQLPHQRQEWEYRDVEGRAFLWHMRTGKSKMAVDVGCHLFQAGKIEAAIVFAPNGPHDDWGWKHLATHHWDCIPYRHHVWSSRNFKRKSHEASLAHVMAPGNGRREMRWLIINSEAILSPRVQKAIKELLKKSKNRVLLIADEIHDFRRPGSKRTVLIRGLRKRVAFSRVLTGTATDNSPLHAYTQFEVVKPGCLGFTRYKDFKDRYAEEEPRTTDRGASYKVVTGWKNMEELRDRMGAHSSVVLRRDVNMPELVFDPRSVPMTEEQARLYRAILDDGLHEIEEADALGLDPETLTGPVLINKLQQVLSGYIIQPDGSVKDIPGESPRLDAAMDVIQGMLPEKTVVWCKYKEDVRRLAKRLREAGIGFRTYFSESTAQEKAEAKRLFNGDPSISVIIGHPKSAGQGLDFSAATTILWYSHIHGDLILRNQGNERASGMMKAAPTVIDLFVPNTVDTDILDGYQNKHDLSQRLTGPGLKEYIKKAREEFSV